MDEITDSKEENSHIQIVFGKGCGFVQESLMQDMWKFHEMAKRESE